MLRRCLLLLLCLALTGNATADDPPSQLKQGTATSSAQEIEAALVLAEQGDAAAQNYLGFLYATGKGVKKDDKAAFNWFRKAADQNHPEAIGNLAVMHEKGLGVEKNMATALALHRQAAMAGYPLSMKRLATLYETGILGETPDPIKAEMWKNRYRDALKAAPPAADKSPVALPSEKSAKTAEAKTETQAPSPAPAAAAVLPSPPTQPLSQPEKPVATPAPHPATSPAKLARPAAPARPAVKATEKTAKPAKTAPVPLPEATPSATASAAPSANEASGKAKTRYAEISGTADAQEVTKLIRRIVNKGLVPKSMQIEVVSPNADSYQLRIGPFPNSEEAATHTEKIRSFISPPAPAEPEPAPALPVPPAAVSPAQVASALPPPAAATQAADSPEPVEEKPAPRTARGRFYFVNINAVNTVKDSLFLAQVLFSKQLVQETHRVKIENLDGQLFQVSIGPFRTAVEARQEAQKISQQTFLQSSVTTFERHGVTEGGEGQHFVQINTHGTLDNALEITQALVKKALLPPALSAEIVNFGSGNYRVRLGPYRGLSEASQSAAKLKAQFDTSPIVLNLDRLVPVTGK